MSPFVTAIIVLAILVVPFFLGGYFSRQLRMPDYSWKFGIILWTAICSVAVVVTYWPPKLGIDLSGGMILIYEVDKTQLKTNAQVDMDKLIGAITKRINPGGVKEINIRKYGNDGIEIVVPDVDENAANRIAELVSHVGALEFRIVANTVDNKAVIDRANSEPEKNILRDSEGNREAWWVPVVPEEAKGFLSDNQIAKRTREKGKEKILEVLVVADHYDVTGNYLDFARASTDRKGKPCVNFVFRPEGGRLFGLMTTENQPDEVQHFFRRLAIILDGEMYSAPNINQPIYQSGEITSDRFTPTEVNNLVDVLNAGALPATLTKEPISKLYCGPTLGSDTIKKSTFALLIAGIIVPLFMLWYYRFAGIIADIVLILNIVILLAIMISVKAAFTLPGFAGFALTVGMAVDNNVLIYERLREELARGAALRMAIRNAFNRATSTIIDCNITHLIAGVVLYAIAPEQIKGFAVVLILGVTISLFTSVFVAKVLFDVAEKHKWITDLKMHHLIGHTNIDFMRLFPYTASLSVIVTVLGLAVAYWRGYGLLDIDFTGGSSIQTLFKEPQKISDIRKTLEDMPKLFPDVTISDVRFTDETPNLRFEVNTSNNNIEQVKEELNKIYAKALKSNEMKIENIGPITEKTTPNLEPSATPSEQPPKSDKPEKSTDNKQSRRWIKSNGLMAVMTAVPLIFGQVDAAAATPPATTKVEQKDATAAKAAEKQVEKAKTAAKAAEEDSSKTARGAIEIADPFLGGTQAKLTFSEKLDHDAVKEQIDNAFKQLNLQDKDIPLEVTRPNYDIGDVSRHNDWTVKIGLPQSKAEEVLNIAKTMLTEAPFFPASNAIGSVVATNTQYLAFYAVVSSWLLIILYLWIRFQGVSFGLAAVIALVHDVLVMLGAIAFSYYLAPYFGWLGIDPFKINLPIIAAFLTIIGYSVNDTIVIFDRIREVRGKDPNLTSEMVNLSTNQTLSRTILTSLTVFMVVVILYFFGGQPLRGFSFALIVGVITGTYSSIYVAAPILLWLIEKRKKA